MTGKYCNLPPFGGVAIRLEKRSECGRVAGMDTLSVPPAVTETCGVSPRFWEGRSVLFFANLLSLFFGNRGETYLLEQEISGVDSYGGRLLPVVSLLFPGGDNLLVLERQPDPALVEYLGATLGLVLPDMAILPHAGYLQLAAATGSGKALPEWPVVSQMANHPAMLVDGFVTDLALSQLSAALGKKTLSTPEGSHRGNNKFLLHCALEDAGLPVFDTHVADSPGAIRDAVAKLKRLGYTSAVVKAQVGASGIGLKRVHVDDPEPAVPSSFFHEGPCMVQGWITPGRAGVREVLSPSVQMFVTADTVALYDLTEQILSGEASVHEGNESPPPYLERLPGLREELFRQAAVAARWLHAQGYRGTASADFLVAIDGSPAGFAAYVCEINARVTGATYPSVLARRFFPGGSWLMRNLKLSHPATGSQVLAALHEHGHLFTGNEPGGILPVNFNLTADGLVDKGQFLCLSQSPGGCSRLLSEAEADLPIDWSYILDR